MALDKYAFSKIARGENPTAGAQGGGNKFNAREYLGGGADSGMSENFMSMRQKIADESDARRAAAEPPAGRKRADGRDYLAATMGKIGENIMGLAGAEEAAKTESKLDDVGSWLLGLPLGTISAPFTGASQLHEAASGHRATEMDDAGYIPSQDLDLGQRLATGASGVINAVGPFFGGSAGMLRGAKNAALMGGATAAGLMGAEDTAKKMASKAIESSAKSIAKEETKGLVGRLASEAAEEGLEEFVQSPLDEIRDGTLDDGWFGRAVEAGTMGALGGVVMSGTGMALDRTFGKMGVKSDSDEGRDRNPVAPSTKTAIDMYAFDDVGGRMVKDAQDAYDERARTAGDLHGAASVKQINSGKARGVNDSDVGAGFFKAVWENPDDGVSAKQVADWFSVDMKTMAEIMTSDDYGERLRDLHRANKAKGIQKPVFMGRNPATEKQGSYSQWVDEIIPDASYVDLSPLAMNFVKSDADGDTVTISLDPSLKTMGFITERMVDAVRGDWDPDAQEYKRRSNLDFGEFSYIPRSITADEAASAIEKAMSSISDGASYQIDEKSKKTTLTKQQLIDRWKSRLSGMSRWDDADFAVFFANVRSDIQRGLADKTLVSNAVGPFSADNVVSDLTRELADTPDAIYARALDKSLSDARRNLEKLKEYIDLGEFDLSDDVNERGYERRGGIQKAVQKLVELFSDLNMIGRRLSTNTTANPLFRQDGMLVMIGQSQEFKKLSEELWNQTGKIMAGSRLDAFEALLSNVIKQTDVAGEVINNVSGIFDDVVRAKTTARFFAKHGKTASTAAEIRDLMDIFASEYQSLLKSYEKARSVATQNMPIEDRNMGKKPELSRDEKDGWFNITVVRAFNETFADSPIDKFIDISNAPTMEGHTIGSFFEQYVYEGRTDRTQFGGMPPEFRSYLNMSVKSVNMRQKQVVKEIESVVGQLSKTLKRIKDEGLNHNNIVEAEFALTSIRKLFDPSMANDLGLTSAARIMTGRFGEELCSGDPDRANNAIEVMAFAAKYDSVYRDLIEARRLLDSGDQATAERLRLGVRVQLSKLAACSNTDRYICSEIAARTADIDALSKASTFSPLFDRLTDLDRSYSEKVHAMETNDVSGGSKLMADALATDSSSAGSSGLSSKSNLCKSSFEMARRANTRKNLEAWNGIKSSLIEQADGQEAVEAIIDLLSDQWLDIGNDVLASSVYASTTLSNAMKEKGVTPQSAMQLTQIIETIINGQLASFSAKHLSRAVGVVSVEDFQSNMSLVIDIILNKDSFIRVVDHATGTEEIINRERIIREASHGMATDFDLTPQNLDYIFTAFPSLLTAIPRASINPIVNPETGEEGVSVANSDPLYASIVQRMGERRRIRMEKGGDSYLEGSRIEHEKNMRIAKVACMSDVGFVSEVILRTPRVAEDMSLPAIKRAVDETVDKIVEGILHDAANDSGKAAHKRTMMVRAGEFWGDLSRSTNRMFRAAAGLADLSTMYVDGRKALADEQADIALTKSIDHAVSNIVKRNLEGTDLNVSDIAAPGAKSASKDIRAIGELRALSASDFAKMSTDLYAIVCAAYPDIMSETTQDIDAVSRGGVVSKWVGRIDRALADGVIDQATHDRIISDIDSGLSDEMSRTAVPDVKLDGILSAHDFDFVNGADPDALYEKISKINARNYNDADMADVRRSINEIRNGLMSHANGEVESAKERASAMIRYWNSVTVKEYIGNTAFKTGVDINPYIIESVFESFDTMERMTESVRRELQAAGRPLGGSDVANPGYKRPTIPPADFSDPVLAYMSGRSLVNATRGNAPLDVGLNGSGVRDREGLGLIPRNIRSEVPPVEMTYADIVSAIAEDNKFSLAENGMGDPASVGVDELGKIGWNRFIGAHECVGQYGPASDGKVPYKLRNIDRRTLERLRSDPSATILVFDPALSPNGIDVDGTYGSMRPGDRRSLRVLMELGVMGDVTQEAMALRSSKQLGSKTRLAEKVATRDNIANPVATRIKNPGDLQESISALRKSLLDFRSEYRDYLNELFKRPENKPLGFGEMQAMTYSRFLTPFVELRFGGESVCVSAKDILSIGTESQKRVTEALSAAAESGEEVTVIPRVVSPEFMESRVGAAEMREFDLSGKSPNKMRAGEAAKKAVEDWSDYRPHSLDVTSLMSGVRPVASNAFPVVHEEDMQSSLNRFLDAARGIDGEETPWNFKRRDMPQISVLTAERARDLADMRNRAGMSIETRADDGSVQSRPVQSIIPVMAFGVGSDRIDGEAVHDASLHFLPIDSSQEGNKGDTVRMDCSTFGIIFEGGDIKEACEWAVHYRQPLMVEKSVIEANEGVFADSIMDSTTTYVIGHGPTRREFTITYPYESSLANTVAQGYPKSDASHVDPDEIALIAFNPTKQSGDSSGQVNSETMADMGNRFLSVLDYPVGKLGGGLRGGSLCNMDDIRKVADLADSGDLEGSLLLRDLGIEDMSREAVIASVADFAKVAKSGGFEYRSTVSRHQTMALLKYSNSSGEARYAPIVIPGNAPKVMENVKPSVGQSGDVSVYGFYNLLAASDDTIKMALASQAHKTQTVAVDPDQMSEFDVIVNGKKLRADLDLNDNTASGRRPGNVERPKMLNGYMGTIKWGGSLFFERDKNGIWKWREKFNEWSEADRQMLLDGNKTIWDQIASGNKPLSDDARLNEIVSLLVRRCPKYGVNPAALFNSISTASLGGSKTVLTGVVQDFMYVANGMSKPQILKLFHSMNPMLCPDWDFERGQAVTYDADGKPIRTIFDEDFNMRAVVRRSDGTLFTIPIDVSLETPRNLGHSSFTDRQSGSAKNSRQRQQRSGMDRPLTGSEVKTVLEDIAIRRGDERALGVMADEHRAKKLEKARKEASGEIEVQEGFSKLTDEDVSAYLGDRAINAPHSYTSYADIKRINDVRSVSETFNRRVPIIGFNGKEIPNPQEIGDAGEYAEDVNTIKDCRDRMSKALGDTIDYDHFIWLLLYDGGTTYNGGVGDFQLSVDAIKQGTDRIVSSLESGGGLPITIDDNAVSLDDRYCVPLLSPEMAAYMYRFPAIKDSEYNSGGISEFKRRMAEEARRAKEQVDNIIANGTTPTRKAMAESKRHALYKFLDWAFLENGMNEVSGYIHGNVYMSDLISNDTNFWDGIIGFTDLEIDRDELRSEIERTASKLADYARLRQEKLNFYENGPYRMTELEKGEIDKIEKILDYMTRVQQSLAVLSPSIMVGNVVSKGVMTNLSSLALRAGREVGLGAYASNVDVSQDAVKMFSHSDKVRKAFLAYRMAMIDGDTASLIAAVDNEAALDKWIENKKRTGIFNRINDGIFNLVNGENLFLSRQIENFMNYFLILEADSGHNFWFSSADRGDGSPHARTIVEEMMTGDGAQKLIIDILLGRNNNVSLDNAQVAMNWAMQGDMAQRNVVSMFYQKAIRRYGNGVKFLTSSFMSKFFQYRTNQIGHVLQYVLPMSSINYEFTKFVAERNAAASKASGGAVLNEHYEDAQVFTSLKRALMNDLMHLGPMAVAMILALIPGLLEPPEDKKKSCNYDEWLIMGMRVRADWELQDILGLTLPLAVSFKSLLSGEPRLDILANGIGDAMFGSPIAKVGDLINLLGEGDGSFWSHYEQDVEAYADAKGDSPSVSQWLAGKGKAFGLTFLGQFITPSFIKEFMDERYEHSYKRVWEEGTSGRETEDGKNGRTMRTDFEDAQIRKVTRSNPVLGLLMNFVSGRDDYIEGKMPLVEVYDPIALDSMKRWSVNDENGDPLPREMQEEKILEIISVLQSTDDMEALYESGFFLDYDTRQAVGDTIWDIVTELNNSFNKLKADGGLNWEMLGEGDTYGLGQQRAQAIYNAYKEERSYWERLYYDKLQSEPMRRSLPVYNRLKTDYSSDSDGNIYASGFLTETGILSSLSPVQLAPGARNDPQGTMGYEGDWATPSVINGQSTGERALVPMATEVLPIVQFEEHAADGNGNGYSKRYQGDGEVTDSNGDVADSDGNGYPPSNGKPYGNRKGGGGGGGGRGGSAPNLYSRLPKAYNPSPKTMYGERLYDTKYDYLRPGFETKGSREAYKRSDI